MSEPQDVCRKCGGLGEVTGYDKENDRTTIEPCHHGQYSSIVQFDRLGIDHVIMLIRSRYGDKAILTGQVIESEKS